jgi:hypothetical protein
MKHTVGIGAFLVVAWLVPIALAAQAGQAAPPSGMSSMQDMMKMRDTMMARMKGDDDQLKALVDKMNKASGDAKVAAMAELITKLAEQRSAEHGSMMSMQGQMMSQMMNMMMTKPATSK